MEFFICDKEVKGSEFFNELCKFNTLYTDYIDEFMEWMTNSDEVVFVKEYLRAQKWG